MVQTETTACLHCQHFSILSLGAVGVGSLGPQTIRDHLYPVKIS